jgi:hypothetical protein
MVESEAHSGRSPEGSMEDLREEASDDEQGQLR